MEANKVISCNEFKSFKIYNEVGNAKLCVTAFVHKSWSFLCADSFSSTLLVRIWTFQDDFFSEVCEGKQVFASRSVKGTHLKDLVSLGVGFGSQSGKSTRK